MKAVEINFRIHWMNEVPGRQLRKTIRSEDNEKRDFLLAQCKDKRMKSHSVAQVVSAIATRCEVKYKIKQLYS
jgi:hypothetical protein